MKPLSHKRLNEDQKYDVMTISLDTQAMDRRSKKQEERKSLK